MAEARLRRGSQADPEPQNPVEEDEDQTDAGAEGSSAEDGPNIEDDGAVDDGSVVIDSETGDERAREAKRQRNREDRQRKKDSERRRRDEDQRKIKLLEQRNDELARRVERVEGHTSSQDIHKIDQAIGTTQQHINHWRGQIAAAASAGDGNALADAQEKWYEARARLDALTGIKTAAVEQQRAPKAPAPLDPMVREHFASWVKDHRWYNGAGKDQDSRIMLAIDNSLADEGFDPATSEYWDELTRRGRQQLPHRFKKAPAVPDYDDDEEDDPMPLANRRRPAPQLSGGSSRESVPSSRTEFRLSPDRVRAMKEAGIWDDPKERADMVKRYREQDRANGANR